MKRILALLERNQARLAEPLHQQRHRGHQVRLLPQGADDQRIGLGRIEMGHPLPPEADIAGRRAGLMKSLQGFGHFAGRFVRLGAGKRFDRVDRVGRELVPPAGQLAHAAGDHRLQRAVVAGGRFAPQPRVQPQNLLHQFDQLVEAMIGHAVFRRGKQAELALETQHVPGVDQRPALDCPTQKVLDLVEHHRGQFELIAASIARCPVVSRH